MVWFETMRCPILGAGEKAVRLGDIIEKVPKPAVWPLGSRADWLSTGVAWQY
jgi:hypothetical protein